MPSDKSADRRWLFTDQKRLDALIDRIRSEYPGTIEELMRVEVKNLSIDEIDGKKLFVIISELCPEENHVFCSSAVAAVRLRIRDQLKLD